VVQIIFEFQTQYGVFRDALYLPEDHGLTGAEIDALKQERVNNWVAFVTPKDPVEPVEPQEPVDGE
jgi:hypothetical protein